MPESKAHVGERCVACKKVVEGWFILERLGWFIRICRECFETFSYKETDPLWQKVVR